MPSRFSHAEAGAFPVSAISMHRGEMQNDERF
nr:MAG TPA: hypothetical protein [Caudoviricetes sp.]